MSYRFKDVSQVVLYNTETNEIVMAWGFKDEIQKESNKLMKLRDKAKRKRLRKKINTKVDKLLRGK